MKTHSRYAIALISFLSTLALAQTPPIDAGKAARETRPELPSSSEKPVLPFIERQDEGKPLVLPEGRVLTLTRFRFEGAEYFSESELQAEVAGYLGRPLTLSEIEAAADRITARYRARGYLVARAYVPRQDASDGTLVIRVMMGKYGKITQKNTSLVEEDRIDAYFSCLADDKAVNREDLERAMLLTGDLPGATLPKVSIFPGSAPDTSDFEVEIGPGKRFGGYAVADNYGSRYTGKNRLSLGATLNSPFRLGDALDFSGMTSEAGDLLNGRLAYSVPLGANGLRGELAVSRTTYELGKEYSVLDAQGRADSLEANFSYPIARGRSQNLTATLGLVGRKLRDEILSDDTTKKAYAATLGLTHDRYTEVGGKDAYFSVVASVTGGRLSIDEHDKRIANKAGANTVGSYGRLNFSLAGRVALTQNLSAIAMLDAQYALGRNLDSSEQLIISGTRGVMAYQDTVSGDNGVLVNVEARYALPAIDSMRHFVSVFADAGHVKAHDGGYSALRTSYSLRDVGLGYTLNWHDLFLRAKVAHVQGSRPSDLQRDGHTRWLVQGGIAF